MSPLAYDDVIRVLAGDRCPVCGEPTLVVEHDSNGGARLWCSREGENGALCEPEVIGSIAADRLAAEESAVAHGPTPREWAPGQGPSSSRRARLARARSIRSEPVRWAWRGRIPRRSMVVVAGGKGLGKSTLTNAWLVAKATMGTLEGEFEGHPLDVLMVTAEDDWRSVVKPRLIAAGADLDRVHRLTIEDASGDPATFTLPDDVRLVEQELEALRQQGVEVGLLVVDPISAFLAERTDSHKDASVRRTLAPLATMAERADLAVVVVAHLTKDEGKRLLSRVSGSGAFVNAARSVLVVARDPADPEGEAGSLRVLVHVAANWGRLAPALAAHVEETLVTLDDGSPEYVPLWVEDGESSVAVEDLQGGGDGEGRTEIEEEILAVLENGQRPSREAKEEVAKSLRVSRRTVERHAVAMAKRGEIEIEVENTFPKTTTWRLPEGDAGSDMAQSRHAQTRQDVATVATRIAEPNPGSSGDSSDTPGVSSRLSRCSCLRPGNRMLDGRCGRCYGAHPENPPEQAGQEDA